MMMMREEEEEAIGEGFVSQNSHLEIVWVYSIYLSIYLSI
jgi:hypothetical protein